MSKHLRIEIPVQENKATSPNSWNHSANGKTPKIRKATIRNRHYQNATQDWLPFEKYVYGMIKLKDGRYIKILEISPQNFSLKKAKDQNQTIEAFSRWIKVAPISFQIKIITEKTDLTSLTEQLNEKTANETDPMVLQGKKDYVELVENLSQTESSSRRFFIIIEYEGNIYDGYKKSSDENQIFDDMSTAVRTISDYFLAMGNPIVEHDDEALFMEEFLYRFICKQSSFTETIKKRKERLIRDLRFVDTMEHPDELPLTQITPSLNMTVSPRGIDFKHPSFAVVDGICYSFIFIRNDSYPTTACANWVNIYDFGEGVDVDMFFHKLDSQRTQTELGRTLARGKAGLVDKNEEDRRDAEDSLYAGMFISEALRAGQELFYGVTMLTIWDASLERMKKRRGIVIERLRSVGIRTLPVLMECDEAFKMALPILYTNNHLFTKFQRNLLTESVASLYPFNELRINDDNGFVLGMVGNSLAIYNNFNTKRYNNANIGIFGPSGSGKTYFNLMLSRRYRLNDVGVLFILPVKGHEYKEAIENMNGLFIDLSPGSNVCLNIMEIHAEATIDAAILAEAEVTARSKLQQQITQVITFVQLLLRDEKLTAPQESALETVLMGLYSDYGITNNNLSIYNEDGTIKTMPTIQELYDRVLNVPALHNVVDVLTVFITGTCKNMNGQTNIALDNKMIAFDVSYAGDRYLPAFMFLALVYCYDKIKENVIDLYALFLDEGWKFMINEMAESFVNELIKIVRGYGGATIFSTQNMADVIKGKFGESIIDNCATKFLLKAGEKEAELFQRLFNLTEQEIKEIMKQPRGRITMLSNGEKVPIVTKTSMKEDMLYTTDPNKKKRQRLLLQAEKDMPQKIQQN